MNYTLHQLKIFLEIVEKKSITKASESLFLTQPAVSIQFKKFQDQFPAPLTEIIGRKLYVTPFGLEIYEAAKKILDEVSEIEYKAHLYQGKLAGKLKISVVSTGKYVMPYYLSKFAEHHPQIDYSMDVTNKLTVVQHLEENSVDFALVSVLPEHLELHRLPLIKNSLFLVGGTARVNQYKSDYNSLLQNEPLLFREPGSATRNEMELFIKNLNIPMMKKMELTSNEALKQAIIAGLGYSIMPLIGIRDSINNNEISVVPFNGLPIHTEWNLVWRKNKNLSVIAKAYLEHLNTEKEEIRKKYFDWIDSF